VCNQHCSLHTEYVHIIPMQWIISISILELLILIDAKLIIVDYIRLILLKYLKYESLHYTSYEIC